MKYKVQFVNLEEDDKDLIISFAIEDSSFTVRSLILLRSLFTEPFLDDDEKGVNVSLEGDEYDQEETNMLEYINVTENEVEIKSTYRNYILDVTNIKQSDIKGILRLLNKQNYDNRFEIKSA